MFCIPKHIADKFTDMIRNGEITPERLAEMSSAERRDFLGFMGEANAKKANAVFESKLLLKNQQRGIVNWAEKIIGLRPDARRDILARVERLSEPLNEQSMRAFKADLIEQRLGFGVTMAEASDIAALSRMVMDQETAMLSGERRMPGGKPTQVELEYGRSAVAFHDYVANLKRAAARPTVGEWLTSPGKMLADASSVGKSMQASMDLSGLGRQAWGALFTNPDSWAKGAIQSFKNFADTLGGKRVMDEVNARIVSDPNYGLMRRAGLSVGTIEEAFPTSLPEKIPLFGRLYKASEVSFTAFLHQLRADIFNKHIEVARRTGVDINDTGTLKGYGKLVNSLTGRGSLGKFEPAADVVNSVFFSARLQKGHFDVLTAHLFDKNVPLPIKKIAAINLLKIVSGTAVILAISDILMPDSVDWDPRSTDFGQIRVGDTRFDVTGGKRGLMTLASRLLPTKGPDGWGLHKKSSTSGRIMALNTGAYGTDTGADVVYDFFENKLSPAGRVALDLWLKQRDFEGREITIGSEAVKFVTPLSIQNAVEVWNAPEGANAILATILEILGISTSTYSRKKRKK